MVEMLLTAAYRIKFHYTVCPWECPPCYTHKHTHTHAPHMAADIIKASGYSGGGPRSHRKWSSQIRLSAAQMMRSQREVKAHAWRAQGRAERWISLLPSPPPTPEKPGQIAHSHSSALVLRLCCVLLNLERFLPQSRPSVSLPAVLGTVYGTSIWSERNPTSHFHTCSLMLMWSGFLLNIYFWKYI